MKIRDLIEKLNKYDSDMEIGIADLQFYCCDCSISILDNLYIDGDNEIYCEDNYDEYEWELIFLEKDLRKVLLLA